LGLELLGEIVTDNDGWAFCDASEGGHPLVAHHLGGHVVLRHDAVVRRVDLGEMIVGVV